MIGFSTVAKLLFCITPPSGCLCVMLEWKKKNERNEIVYFYRTHSDILLYGTARFSRGNNKLTFQPQKWKKIKNSQPQTKFTGSYKKKECIYIYWNSWWRTNRCWTLSSVELFKPTFIYNLTLEVYANFPNVCVLFFITAVVANYCICQIGCCQQIWNWLLRHCHWTGFFKCIFLIFFFFLKKWNKQR